MSDILSAMREFRALDDKRRTHGLDEAEEARWNLLRSAVKGKGTATPGPAAAAAASAEPKLAFLEPTEEAKAQPARDPWLDALAEVEAARARLAAIAAAPAELPPALAAADPWGDGPAPAAPSAVPPELADTVRGLPLPAAARELDPDRTVRELPLPKAAAIDPEKTAKEVPLPEAALDPDKTAKEVPLPEAAIDPEEQEVTPPAASSDETAAQEVALPGSEPAPPTAEPALPAQGSTESETTAEPALQPPPDAASSGAEPAVEEVQLPAPAPVEPAGVLEPRTDGNDAPPVVGQAPADFTAVALPGPTTPPVAPPTRQERSAEAASTDALPSAPLPSPTTPGPAPFDLWAATPGPGPAVSPEMLPFELSRVPEPVDQDPERIAAGFDTFGEDAPPSAETTAIHGPSVPWDLSNGPPPEPQADPREEEDEVDLVEVDEMIEPESAGAEPAAVALPAAEEIAAAPAVVGQPLAKLALVRKQRDDVGVPAERSPQPQPPAEDADAPALGLAEGELLAPPDEFEPASDEFPLVELSPEDEVELAQPTVESTLLSPPASALEEQAAKTEAAPASDAEAQATQVLEPDASAGSASEPHATPLPDAPMPDAAFLDAEASAAPTAEAYAAPLADAAAPAADAHTAPLPHADAPIADAPFLDADALAAPAPAAPSADDLPAALPEVAASPTEPPAPIELPDADPEPMELLSGPPAELAHGVLEPAAADAAGMELELTESFEELTLDDSEESELELAPAIDFLDAAAESALQASEAELPPLAEPEIPQPAPTRAERLVRTKPPAPPPEALSPPPAAPSAEPAPIAEPVPSAPPEKTVPAAPLPPIAADPLPERAPAAAPLPEPALPPTPVAPAAAAPGEPAPAAAMTPLSHRFPGEFRVVVHTREGAVKRGQVKNANLLAEKLRLYVDSAEQLLPIPSLKAVFFMRTPQDPAPQPAGRKVRLVFEDGRPLRGYADPAETSAAGFSLIPEDLRGNTARVFVYRAAVREIAFE